MVKAAGSITRQLILHVTSRELHQIEADAMFEYFCGWKRKAGGITLALACLFAAAWIRSLETINRFTMKTAQYEFNWFASSNGSVVWLRIVPLNESNLSKEIHGIVPEIVGEAVEGLAEYLSATILSGDPPFQWKYRYFGLEVGQYRLEASSPIQVTIRKLSYWIFITPLTLLSAYLLLSKPRAKAISMSVSK